MSTAGAVAAMNVANAAAAARHTRACIEIWNATGTVAPNCVDAIHTFVHSSDAITVPVGVVIASQVLEIVIPLMLLAIVVTGIWMFLSWGK